MPFYTPQMYLNTIKDHRLCRWSYKRGFFTAPFIISLIVDPENPLVRSGCLQQSGYHTPPTAGIPYSDLIAPFISFPFISKNNSTFRNFEMVNHKEKFRRAQYSMFIE